MSAQRESQAPVESIRDHHMADRPGPGGGRHRLREICGRQAATGQAARERPGGRLDQRLRGRRICSTRTPASGAVAP